MSRDVLINLGDVLLDRGSKRDYPALLLHIFCGDSVMPEY